MLDLLILDYKIGYRLWFVCQWIQFMIWFLELDISCDLFGYRYNWWFDFIFKKRKRTIAIGKHVASFFTVFLICVNAFKISVVHRYGVRSYTINEIYILFTLFIVVFDFISF